MRMRAAMLALALCACGEVPRGFEPVDPFDSISPNDAGRLTWNLGADQVPAWSPSSDSLYFSIDYGYPGLPEFRDILAMVPRSPGRTQVLIESLYRGRPVMPKLMAPAVSPDGQSIAFVEVIQDSIEQHCRDGIYCPTGPFAPDLKNSKAELQHGILRVRSMRGGGEEARLAFDFDTVAHYIRISYPFQRQFERDRAQTFRPSWSTDGKRLVFSDGQRLLLWTVGSPSATPIPNTEDGVWPAWRPNSNTLAFIQLRRLGSYYVQCQCNNEDPSKASPQHRTIYLDGDERGGELFTINIDGSGRRSLGEGETPAWSPNGQTLFVSRGDHIWQMNPDGSNAQIIEKTLFGFEPQVSPDGKWLAFSRTRDRDISRRLYDIWVVGL